jgi:hypothetical protein
MATGNRYAFRVRPGMRQGLATEMPIPTRLISNEESRRSRRRRSSSGSSITSWTRPAGWRPAWG